LLLLRIPTLVFQLLSCLLPCCNPILRAVLELGICPCGIALPQFRNHYYDPSIVFRQVHWQVRILSGNAVKVRPGPEDFLHGLLPDAQLTDGGPSESLELSTGVAGLPFSAAPGWLLDLLVLTKQARTANAASTKQAMDNTK
jgi:hypothetical protein